MDIKYYVVPNNIILSFTILLISYSVSCSANMLSFNYTNVIFFGILFYLISIITHGLGMGDVKIICIISFLEDFLSVCVIGIMATMIGAFFLIIHNIVYHRKLYKIPFVPCLTIAFFVTEVLKIVIKCKVNEIGHYFLYSF